MSEPHIKVRPGEDGMLLYEVDQDGHEYFQRLVSRAEPRRNDNTEAFRTWKDRVAGAFFAGASVMGWRK